VENAKQNNRECKQMWEHNQRPRETQAAEEKDKKQEQMNILG